MPPMDGSAPARYAAINFASFPRSIIYRPLPDGNPPPTSLALTVGVGATLHFKESPTSSASSVIFPFRPLSLLLKWVPFSS